MSRFSAEVLKLVDPDDWLHLVPRAILRDFCQEQGLKKAGNLERAHDNGEKKGFHFTHQTEDKRGALQALHHLRWIQKVDEQMRPVTSRAPEPVLNEPTAYVAWARDNKADMRQLNPTSFR